MQERTPGAAPLPGVWSLARHIMRTEGTRALWRGATPRLCRLIVGGGVTFLCVSGKLLCPPRSAAQLLTCVALLPFLVRRGRLLGQRRHVGIAPLLTSALSRPFSRFFTRRNGDTVLHRHERKNCAASCRRSKTSVTYDVSLSRPSKYWIASSSPRSRRNLSCTWRGRRGEDEHQHLSHSISLCLERAQQGLTLSTALSGSMRMSGMLASTMSATRLRMRLEFLRRLV